MMFAPNMSEQLNEAKSILSRKEAKARLSKLIPGTEEYYKLQDALLKTSGILEIWLPNTTYKVNSSSESHALPGGFGSSEHIAIGEAVVLQGLKKNTPLLTRGVTPILFQHIVALAGDFYGIAGRAISLPGGTDLDKTERFVAAFNTLAQAESNEIRRILLEIDRECHEVRHSSLPHHCYSSHMIEHTQVTSKIKGDIIELLADNSDHFSTNAEDAYRIGHTYAMSVAREAGRKNDTEGLKLAYAFDAFACHFLTDLFAAGHIRNQRGKLESFLVSQLGFSESQAKPLAGILTGAQHEKDGGDGLNVSNQRGDHWRAFGDGCFFSVKNEENKARAIATTQQSADEVYNAYSNPDSEKPSIIDQLIPHATPFNPLPIYSIEGTALFVHRSGEKIEITSKASYFAEGIQQALRYLPQEYINGVITPFKIELPPVLSKVIIPQIERLTGSIWCMVGLASYHQVKQQNMGLNQKIDEMADTLKATYTNSVEILQQLQNVHFKLDQLGWTSLCKEINVAIAKIRDAIHLYQGYRKSHNQDQLQGLETTLWKAGGTLSRIFSQGTVADGRHVLATYRQLLETNSTSMSASAIKITVTMWFRQILDYQVQAFGLYATLRALRNDYLEGTIYSEISAFESLLMKQLETSREHIDVSLVYENQGYIKQQLEKSKIIQLNLARLNIIPK